MNLLRSVHLCLPFGPHFSRSGIYRRPATMQRSSRPVRRRLLGGSAWSGLLGALLLVIFTGRPTPAFAFAEDVCAEGGTWTVCSLNPCPPGAGSQGIVCGAISMLTTVVSGLVRGDGSRSTIHFDSIYLLAQAAGFSPADAYAVAAYDQAVDTGQFTYRSEGGTIPVNASDCGGASPPAACELITADISGLDRNNFQDGGTFFHFQTIPNTAPTINGLAPAISDPASEPFLYYERRWAYGQGPLCMAGLVGSNNACFVSKFRKVSNLLGYMPFATGTTIDTVSWVAVIGEQQVAVNPATGALTPASQLGSYVPAALLPLAKLGIYLHSLQDRISHHICVDISTQQGPRGPSLPIPLNVLPNTVFGLLNSIPSLQDTLNFLLSMNLTADPDYIMDFDINDLVHLLSTECDQLDHAERHTWETGNDQGSLPPEDQTTQAGLLNALAELQAFAQAQGFPNAQTLSSSQAQQIVDDLIVALEKPIATDRITSLTGVAQQYGWLPLPLYQGTTLSDWDAAAGDHFFAAP